MLEDQRCLTTLEPWIDAATSFSALLTTTGRLALAGRGTTTFSNALVVSTLIVGETGEDRGASRLHRQGSEEGN